LASNFEGLSNTKRHAKANGINAGGINAGADGNDVGGIVGSIEDLFGIFASKVCASLERLHGSVYPLCECLNGNNSLLSARGGDGMLVTTQWGMATAPSSDASRNAVNKKNDDSNTNLLASPKMLFMLNTYRHLIYQDFSKHCSFLKKECAEPFSQWK